jgi:hypothetical protein
VNHRDPVTAFTWLAASLGLSRRRGRQGTCPEIARETTVTSPASGAGGAADLPGYAPVPRPALGPALNDRGYYVGRVERNLYWVTGVLAAADIEIFTWTTTFAIMQSLRGAGRVPGLGDRPRVISGVWGGTSEDERRALRRPAEKK